MQITKDTFQSMIRRILREVVEKNETKRDFQKHRVPEMNADGVDPQKKNKTFATDSGTKDRKSKEELIVDLEKAVKSVDETALVLWTDHDDIMVRSRDLVFFRISPNWEDNYRIETMRRNEDRYWVSNLDWEQVKDFVKERIKNIDKLPTAIDKAYDKSYRNREDQTLTNDKGLPQKDKPELKPLTDKPLKTSKNKEKDYTEDQTKKNDDLPNKPLKEVESFKRQEEHKVKDPVRLRRRKPDTKLITKDFAG